MREETTFFAPVREIEVVGAGAERATTCVDALSHRPLWAYSQYSQLRIRIFKNLTLGIFAEVLQGKVSYRELVTLGSAGLRISFFL